MEFQEGGGMIHVNVWIQHIVFILQLKNKVKQDKKFYIQQNSSKMEETLK